MMGWKTFSGAAACAIVALQGSGQAAVVGITGVTPTPAPAAFGSLNGPLVATSFTTAQGTTSSIRNMIQAEVEQIDFARRLVTTTQPGDVVIFHALTPHQSGQNTSTRSRRQFYLTYAAAKHGDLYASFYESDRTMRMPAEMQSNPRVFYR